MKSTAFASAAVLLLFALACGTGRKSASGFRLPDGNVEHGRVAFADLRCNACHRVQGLDLPKPTAHPEVPVLLGGRVPYARTDGELVTSIIDPSYRIAGGYPRELVAAGGRSRMPDMSDRITAHQVADLVAFLQSRYEVVPPQPVR
jgi:mono/diheme cytochrome c family protein